jgi:hypothetical protein
MIWDVQWFIPDPNPRSGSWFFLPIPDPRYRGQKGTGSLNRIRTTEFKYFSFFCFPFSTYKTLIHCYSLDDGLHVEDLYDRCRVCVQAFCVRVHALEKLRILQFIKLRFVCKENRKYFNAFFKKNYYLGIRKKLRKICTVLFKGECH